MSVRQPAALPAIRHPRIRLSQPAWSAARACTDACTRSRQRSNHVHVASSATYSHATLEVRGGALSPPERERAIPPERAPRPIACAVTRPIRLARVCAACAHGGRAARTHAHVLRKAAADARGKGSGLLLRLEGVEGAGGLLLPHEALAVLVLDRPVEDEH